MSSIHIPNAAMMMPSPASVIGASHPAVSSNPGSNLMIPIGLRICVASKGVPRLVNLKLVRQSALVSAVSA